MKLRFHKIIPEGKSIIYPKEEEEEGKIIDLNVIVLPSQQKKEKQ